MLTERGTVKTGTKLDEKLFSELNGNLRKLCILYIVLGALLVALGTVVLCLEVFFEEKDLTYGIMVLALGAVLIFIGIFLNLYYKNFNNAAIKMNRVEEVEFCDGYMMEWEYTDGELTSTNKVYYKWIVKVKETKNYLFLYNTRVTAIGVDKNSLPLNELNIIRALLGRPNATPTVPTPNSASDVPPAEPFSDMTDNKEE